MHHERCRPALIVVVLLSIDISLASQAPKASRILLQAMPDGLGDAHLYHGLRLGRVGCALPIATISHALVFWR